MIHVCLNKRDGKTGTTSRYNYIVIDRWQRESTGQKEMKSEDINLFCNGWSDIKVIGDWSCGQGLVNTDYALSSTTASWLLIILLLAFLHKSGLDSGCKCLFSMERCYQHPQRRVSFTISTRDNRYRESLALAACLGDRTVCSRCRGLFVQRKPRDRLATTWSFALSKQVDHSWQPAPDADGALQPQFERNWLAWLELSWQPQLMRVEVFREEDEGRWSRLVLRDLCL